MASLTPNTKQNRVILRITQSLARVASLLYFRISLNGLERVPKEGSLLIVANHSSHLDPPLVGAWLWRPMGFMAKSELFENKLLGPYIERLGAYSIHRGASDRAAIKKTVDILKQGGAVIVFPEGTRSRDGKLREAQPGVSMILNQVPETTILPVRLDGTWKAWGGGRKFPLPRKVSLHVGKTFTVSALLTQEKVKKRLYREIGEEIMQRIAKA